MLEDDILLYVQSHNHISPILKMEIIHGGRINLYKSVYYPHSKTYCPQLEHIDKRIERIRTDETTSKGLRHCDIGVFRFVIPLNQTSDR